ncbi:translation initiation factor SUI1 [Immersiella caudata]|uniref:Translation initiation factor SUI1 n=1 Tax=Immersiella caudata TaxID=314043 RepID=A0AA39XGP9_9PEZI|nr:translation initiation factor SUI1 [Immersiella caudata]
MAAILRAWPLFSVGVGRSVALVINLMNPGAVLQQHPHPHRTVQRDTITVVGRYLPLPLHKPISQGHPEKLEFMSIENLKSYDPFAEADDDSGQTKQTQEYIHIRIQQRNGRKTLTTVQGIPSKFDHKKILKVVKKDFACNGTIISDTESKGMGEVIQLQGDQRLKIKEFLTNKDEGLGLDEKTIKVHGF